MLIESFNITPFVIALLINFIFGGLWHSPLMFGNMHLLHVDKKENSDRPMRDDLFPYLSVYQIIENIGRFYILLTFLYKLYGDNITFYKGFNCVTWLWLGFVALPQLSTAVWENRSFENYFIKVMPVLISFYIFVGCYTLF